LFWRLWDFFLAFPRERKNISFFIFLLSFPLYAFDQSKTAYEFPIYWETNAIKINIDAQNNDMSSQVAKSIILSSMQNWNSVSPLVIYESTSTSNTISFSDNKNLFGPGVVAVTKLNYASSSGKITSFNILINQTELGVDRQFFLISNSAASTNSSIYLGDVVTHELGHMQGLAHSEVLDSSMFYAAFKGQSSVGLDDEAGVKSIYQNSQEGIEGIIRGGNQVPIFGVHVQAISIKKNLIASATISDENGYFYLRGLDKDDKYLIYLSPLKNKSQLQSRYQTVLADYCPGSFVGDFAQGCSSNSKGHPQVFSFLAGEKKDVGILTIRCHQRTSPDYLSDKYSNNGVISESWYDVSEFLPVTGFFPVSQVLTTSFQNQIYDSFQIDLTSRADLASIGNYLSFNLLSQALGTPLTFQVKVDGPFGTLTYFNSIDGFSGQIQNDIKARYPLSSTASQNIFTITIYPALQSQTNQLLTFPILENFVDGKNPYVFIASITQGSIDNETYLHWPLSYDQNDERSCLEAPFSISTKPFVEVSQRLNEQMSSKDQNTKALPIACGQLQGPDDPFGGLFSGLIGLFLVFYLRKFLLLKRKFTLP
jgi:predicted Zn-dependent protease